jgi:DNA polymerase-3 subunit delta
MILKRRADIERYLGAPASSLAALLYGPDLGLVRERAAILAKATTARPDDPFDVAIVAESDLENDDGRLEEELTAISMMGGRRLVRVRLNNDKPGTEDALSKILASHVAGDFNAEAFLLVEAGNLRATSPLRKVAERAELCATIPCYSDEPGDVARMAREALAADKLGLAPDAMDLFVARLPQERGVARQEIERLALYLGPGSGAVGSSADLAGFLGVEPEASLADAADDAFGGRLGAAHAGIRRASQEGEAGPAAVRAMGLHLGRLRRAIVMNQAGMALPQVVKELRIFWKAEREFMRQARGWTLADIDRIQSEILAADEACKQTGSPDQLIGEHLALSIAARAKRLGL